MINQEPGDTLAKIFSSLSSDQVERVGRSSKDLTGLLDNLDLTDEEAFERDRDKWRYAYSDTLTIAELMAYYSTSNRAQQMTLRLRKHFARQTLVRAMDVAHTVQDKGELRKTKERFRNYWRREVARPIIIKKINPKTGKLEEQLLQEAHTKNGEIINPDLNGYGGNYHLKYKIKPGAFDRIASDEAGELSHTRTALYLCQQQLRTMLVDRHLENPENPDTEETATYQRLPVKEQYAIVLYHQGRAKKIFVTFDDIVSNPTSFIKKGIRALNQPTDWKKFRPNQHDKEWQEAMTGQTLIQHVEDEVADPNNLYSCDLALNLEHEDELQFGDDVLMPSKSHRGNFGCRRKIVVNAGHNDKGELSTIDFGIWHPLTDGAQAKRELQNTLRRVINATKTKKFLQRPQVSAEDAAPSKSSLEPHLPYQSRSREKREQLSLECELDITDEIKRINKIFPILKKAWPLPLGEKTYGLEFPVYQVLLYAVMQTFGLDLAHQLIFEASTGSLLQNPVTLADGIRENIPKWHKLTPKERTRLRRQLINSAAVATMDRKTANDKESDVGMGVVRTLALMAGYETRDIVRLLGNIFTKEITRLTDGLFVSSSLMPNLAFDENGYVRGANEEVTNPFYLDEFITVISQQNFTQGGLGMCHRIERTTSGDHVFCKLNIRKNAGFPKKEVDFAREVKANLQMFIDYLERQLMPLAVDSAHDTIRRADITEFQSDETLIRPPETTE